VSKVKQGSLQEVKLLLDEETAQRVELQKLKGKTFGESIYLFSVSPLLRIQGKLEADAIVIFTKIPTTKGAIHKDSTGDVLVSWSDVEIEPTQAPKDLLFLDFDIPKPVRVFLWIMISLTLILIGLVLARFRAKWLTKRQRKLIREKMKEDLYQASDYTKIVSAWQNKHHYVKQFPHLDAPFRILEVTLFKYQFKQSQSDHEKEEVIKAWKVFLESSKGGFNGI
jgi:hypothetical protein